MEERLTQWMAALERPRWDDSEGRERVAEEMRRVGGDVLFVLLAAKLTDADPEVRCQAVTTLLRVDASRTLALVLPMLSDPDWIVRWHTSGCLHNFGDERAIEPLIDLLGDDPEPSVRVNAAYALGGIASPAAIPALLAALDSDHEENPLGHTPSSCAATALDEILGTNETRVRVTDSLRCMATWPPDLDRLRRLATEMYEEWSAVN